MDREALLRALRPLCEYAEFKPLLEETEDYLLWFLWRQQIRRAEEGLKRGTRIDDEHLIRTVTHWAELLDEEIEWRNNPKDGRQRLAVFGEKAWVLVEEVEDWETVRFWRVVKHKSPEIPSAVPLWIGMGVTAEDWERVFRGEREGMERTSGGAEVAAGERADAEGRGGHPTTAGSDDLVRSARSTLESVPVRGATPFSFRAVAEARPRVLGGVGEDGDARRDQPRLPWELTLVSEDEDQTVFRTPSGALLRRYHRKPWVKRVEP